MHPFASAGVPIMVASLLGAGIAVAGSSDVLVGTFEGQASTERGDVYFPNFRLVFNADRTYTWEMLDSWEVSFELDDDYFDLTFPALSASGTYSYDKTIGRLALSSNWTGNLQSTSDPLAYCTRFDFVTTGLGLIIQADESDIRGQLIGRADYLFHGQRIEADPDFVNVRFDNTNLLKPDLYIESIWWWPPTMRDNEEVVIGFNTRNGGRRPSTACNYAVDADGITKTRASLMCCTRVV